MLQRLLVVALALVVMNAVPALAQTFGRNKVHYDHFDFHILETQHFEIYYYQSERDAAVQAGRLAERWYQKLSLALGHVFRRRQAIILYASHTHFAQTNVVPGRLGDSVGGLTEHQKGRMVLSFASTLRDTEHVLGHELVHAFQREILAENGGSISSLPLWFSEGMAEYLSLGGVEPHTAMWLRDAVEQQRLPRISQLNDPRWFPYRYGQALWAFLSQTYGEDLASRSLRVKARGGAVGRLTTLTGKDERHLTARWHEALRELPGAVLARNSESDWNHEQAEHRIVGGSGRKGQLNVGPALSPDGRSLIYLSDQSGYAVDVVLADATTGVVQRELTQTAGRAHFDTLQFLESSGEWDWSGTRYALGAVADGRPVLAIFDIESGAPPAEIAVSGVDQVLDPTWSPDGRHVAFSGLAGGVTDLYVLDLATGIARALTHDAFADVQPSWSPDGTTLVFASDRSSTDLARLSFGKLRLATFSLLAEQIHEVHGLDDAKHIDPHWSSDGRHIFFISDADGASNVYRLSLDDDSIMKVTSISTGVSGVTAGAPALSVSAHTDQLAFSIYRKGAYEIHSSRRENTSSVPSATPTRLARSSGSSRSRIAGTGRLAGTDLVVVPDATTFVDKPYRSALSFNGAIQPYLTAGGGAIGGFLRGGVSMSFGDFLGDHDLHTALQVGKSTDDLVVEAAYANRGSRWNWRIGGEHVPWFTSLTRSPFAVDTGDTLTRHTSVSRDLHRRLNGLVVYPFSSTARFELTGGVDQISSELRTTLSQYASDSGRLLAETKSTTASTGSLMLVETGAALVADSSVMGPTSPVLGRRLRFAVAPTFGNRAFTTVTADYRRYMMPVRPLTVAMRLMHVGRYGPGARDPRLLPLAWTLRDLVRGYGDAGPTTTTTRFLRSNRLLVGNLELRMPLNSFVRPLASLLPLEGLLFADAGQFWMRQPSGHIAPATLASLGGGIRVNGGGMVFELVGTRRYSSAASGWSVAFNFRPGF